MDKATFSQIIFEWQNLISETQGISRSYENDLYEVMGSKPIKIITGFRRSGKSFLVQRTVARMISEKTIKKKNVLYLNFEEYKLAKVNNAEQLDLVFQLFMNEIAEDGKRLVVLDEIQLVTDWDKFVRTIYEKYRNIEIVLTGSNSELLSSEIGSNLAGRFIEIQILPFDFKEFLRIREFDVKKESDYYENGNKINGMFKEFLEFGGLPELISINSEKAKKSYLEGVLSKVVLDDIVERFNVRQVSVVESVMKFLFVGAGNITSYARIVAHLKNAGFEMKSDTVANYVDYIIKTFAVYSLEKLEYKQSRVFSSIKKFYSVDTAFPSIYGGYLQLYFGQNESGKEIDFVVTDKNRSFTNYQVTVTLNDSNKERELSSFVSIDRYISNGKHILLSTDTDEGVIEYSGVKIQRQNIVKWLLDI